MGKLMWQDSAEAHSPFTTSFALSVQFQNVSIEISIE